MKVVVVCAPWALPGFFDDDIRTECARCGEPVRVRPHAPEGERICAGCFVIAVALAKLPTDVHVTEESRKEFAEIMKRKMH